MRNLVRLCFGLALIAVILGAFAPRAMAQTEPRPEKKGRKYTVKIDSSPQQAAIYLDDKKYGIVGYTPWTGKLTQGNYTLIVELPGFKSVTLPITVDRSHREFGPYPLEKQPQPGTVDVQATADQNVMGATVLIDNLSQGTAPLIVDVKDGRHQVIVKKDGFEDFSQWVDVKEGQRITLTPVLKPLVKATPKGSLLVDADVPDAEVIVDGQKAPDTTPTLVDNLDEGPHVVEVRKAPAVPWKQTIYVKGGQRTKVTAELAATMTTTKKGGNVRVLSSVDGAEVWLDGKLIGIAPQDLNDIPPGEHLIEVKARGYGNKEQRVTVNAGSSNIIKFELVAQQTGPGTTGKLKVVSPVPEAKVFIDGAAVGTAPVDKDVAAGEHFVTVEQTGYAKFEQKVSVEAGQTVTITAVLKAVGKVRFLSTPPGAEVVLNGQSIGKTPLAQDIDAGDHVVTIRLQGYYDYEENVSVKGGDTVNVNPTLRIIDTGPTPEEVSRRKWALSSFGARVMPFGDFTVDGAIGYPYWTELRATVGVKDKGQLGWDVGVGFRSLLTTWEFLGTARVRYFERAPFSFAFFGTIGGGGGFDGRNQFTLQAGALNTITFGGQSTTVTITGRVYLDIWSDRLCGLDKDGKVLTGANDICKIGDNPTGPNAMYYTERLDSFGLKPGDVLNRDNGVRLYLSLAAEVAFSRQMSFFLIFEGPPFQHERAGHSQLFNGALLSDTDPIYNGKIGLTLKF